MYITSNISKPGMDVAELVSIVRPMPASNRSFNMAKWTFSKR